MRAASVAGHPGDGFAAGHAGRIPGRGAGEGLAPGVGGRARAAGVGGAAAVHVAVARPPVAAAVRDPLQTSAQGLLSRRSLTGSSSADLTRTRLQP